jgi:hypothetical protein
MAKYQVTLGAEVLRESGLEIGDRLWVARNPDRPGTLILIPEGLMGEVFQKGWTAA